MGAYVNLQMVSFFALAVLYFALLIYLIVFGGATAMERSSYLDHLKELVLLFAPVGVGSGLLRSTLPTIATSTTAPSEAPTDEPQPR